MSPLILQGFLEAFPLSSSMHLQMLFPAYQESAIMHLGSAIAFFLIIRKFIFNVLKKFKINIMFKTFIMVIPTIIIGYIIRNKALDIGYVYVNLICALLMLFADFRKRNRSILSLNTFEAGMIGAIIVGAFIPGTSRMGITFTALRLFRIRRKDALILSILIGIPITAGAATLGILNNYSHITLMHSLLAGIITYFALIITFKLSNYWWIYSIYRILLSSILIIKTIHLF